MDQAGGQAGTRGLAYIMLAAALWATVGVASRAVPPSVSLSDDLLGVARMAIGGPAILLLAFVLRGARPGDLRRLEARKLTCFALGCAVFQIGLFRAFADLGVTATVFLTVCLPPILALVWQVAGRGQRPTGGAVLALALGMLGLAVFAASTGQSGTTGREGAGLGFALAASVAFVVMTESARTLTLAAGPLIVVGAGLSLAGLVLLPVLLVVGVSAPAAAGRADWQAIALVLYLGLGPTALAYVAYCHGMARCRSATVGLIASMIEPALAALLAWIVLAERLSAGEAAGCAILTLAMVLLWRAETRVGQRTPVGTGEGAQTAH